MINFKSSTHRFYIFFAIFAVLLILSAYFLYPIFLPLSISCFLAYLLSPTVDYFSENFSLPRALVTIASLLMISILLSVVVSGLFPYLFKQAEEIYILGSRAFESLIPRWVSTIKHEVVTNNIMTGAQFDLYIRDGSNYSKALDQFAGTVSSIWHSTPVIIGRIANFALVPVFTFFILKDLPLIKGLFWRACPVDQRQSFSGLFHSVDLTIATVLKGQVLVAFIDGLFYIILFSALGLKGALAIGLAGGIARIVPYLDIFVTAVLASMVALTNFESGFIFLWIALGITCIQMFDAIFMTPRILGGRVGLHPGVIIAAMIVFGTWYGFWGVLIAIPTTALAKLAISSIFSLYYASDFYCPSETSES